MTVYRHLGSIVAVYGLLLLSPVSFRSVAAADQVQITDLLTSPERHAFRPVRVEATVTNLRTESFINQTLRKPVCHQFFTLEDGTGALEARYLTLCPLGTPLVRNGDRVIVEASFERAPGTPGYLNVQTVKKP